LKLSDYQFRGYLIQLFYHLILAQKEKGILTINYSMRELIWDHKDADGRSWFYRPANPKKPGLECWSVFMAIDDPVRNMLGSRCGGARNSSCGLCSTMIR
jgi:hypothetical protein